jgi:hypothetical protein
MAQSLGGEGLSAGAQPFGVELLVAPSPQHLKALLERLAVELAAAGKGGENNQQPRRSLVLHFSSDRVSRSVAAGREEKQQRGVGAHGNATFSMASVWDGGGVAAPNPSVPQGDSLDPWLSSALLHSSSPFSLAPSVALYSAYDLWTAARWAPHYLPPSATPAASPSASAALSGGASLAAQHPALDNVVRVGHPRLLFILPHILRLDPCASARIVLPPLDSSGKEDIAGLAEGLVEAVKAGGVDASSVARQYALEFFEHAASALKSFPSRVRIDRG